MNQIDIFRSEECVERYLRRSKEINDIGGTDLRELPFVKGWDLWVLVKNEFPYDRIAENHCLLVPKRRFTDDEEMSIEERHELFEIKREFSGDKSFDLMCESMAYDRSVPGMFHLHFLKLKYRTPLSDFRGIDK